MCGHNVTYFWDQASHCVTRTSGGRGMTSCLSWVSYFELHELRASCDTAGWVKSQNKEAGFCIEERDREGRRRGGRLEPSFSIRCFAPLPLPACLTSLTRPTLRIVRPQWRRHNKRGSVRQKLVWVAIYSVMVGSESKVEEILKKCRAGFSWLWCRNVEECPMMLGLNKVDARTLCGGDLCWKVSDTFAKKSRDP